jgi:transposase InsO family protein
VAGGVGATSGADVGAPTERRGVARSAPSASQTLGGASCCDGLGGRVGRRRQLHAQVLGTASLYGWGERVAEVVTEALSALLGLELRFLISDRGTHFTAGTLKARIWSDTLIHVYTARRRPESNAIAERFVRTLKE